MVRLLLQHRIGKIPDDQFAEILALPIRENNLAITHAVRQNMERMAGMLHYITETTIPKESVLRLNTSLLNQRGNRSDTSKGSHGYH